MLDVPFGLDSLRMPRRSRWSWKMLLAAVKISGLRGAHVQGVYTTISGFGVSQIWKPNLVRARPREEKSQRHAGRSARSSEREVVRWLLLRWKLLDGGRLLENL